MEITDIRIFPVSEDKLKGYASIVFDDCFLVNDIKIIEGRDGLFISMPARKRRDGRFKDIAHPINSETRRWLEEKILAHYEKSRGEAADRRPQGAEARQLGKAEAVSPSQGACEATVPPAAPAGSEGQPAKEEKIDRILDDSFWLDETGKDDADR